MSDIRRFEGPDPSNLELFRAIEAHRIDTRERLKDLENRIATTVVNRDYFLAVYQSQESRIDDLFSERRDTQSFRRNMIVATVTIFATSMATLLTTLIHIHG